MVTAFQDLCLGAPLSDVLLLIPLVCAEGDKLKKDGTGFIVKGTSDRVELQTEQSDL